LVVSVIVERISQPDVARGFILDGFPRTVFQAAALDDVLLIEERELSCVLELKGDERILLDRILGRAVQARANGEPVRADDNEEAQRAFDRLRQPNETPNRILSRQGPVEDHRCFPGDRSCHGSAD